MVADLPVGETLLDHIMVLLPGTMNKDIGVTPEKLNSWSTQLEYNIFGSGKPSGIDPLRCDIIRTYQLDYLFQNIMLSILSLQINLLIIFILDYISLGLKGSSGLAGTGFRTAGPQGKDDPRPFLQMATFASHFGSDGDLIDFMGDKLSFKSDVGIAFVLLSYPTLIHGVRFDEVDIIF